MANDLKSVLAAAAFIAAGLAHSERIRAIQSQCVGSIQSSGTHRRSN